MNTRDRKSGLGASDAAPACGLSKWKTPLQLYKEKTGEAPDSFKETLAVQLGSALEPFILQQLVRDRKVELSQLQRQFFDPNRSWRWATVDAIADGKALVEAKNSMYGHEFTETDIPMQYAVQVAHSLGCTGLQMALVPVLIGVSELRVYEIQRDDELIDLITAREEEFWQRVMDRTPPDPVSVAEANQLYRYAAPGTVAIADPDIEEALRRLVSLNHTIRFAEKSRAELELQVKQAMGENETLVGASGEIFATWKSHNEKRIDVKTLRKEDPETAKKFEIEIPKRVFLPKIKVEESDDE